MAEHVCPWWVGYLLISPIRRLSQKPEKILGAFVREGMTVLDVGCAMGFFSLPLARMVGSGGRVVCVDIQRRMFKTLNKRAAKANLADRIETRLCTNNTLGIDDLSGKANFALAFAVLHEVSDGLERVLSEIYASVAPKGLVLIAEPKGHVSEKEFEDTINAAKKVGFTVNEKLQIKGISRCYWKSLLQRRR